MDVCLYTVVELFVKKNIWRFSSSPAEMFLVSYALEVGVSLSCQKKKGQILSLYPLILSPGDFWLTCFTVEFLMIFLICFTCDIFV